MKWPSWGPDEQPPICVKESFKPCARDCKNAPKEVEYGSYHCVRHPDAWKTECVLTCTPGINQNHLEYMVKDPSRAIITCNSDDEWLDITGKKVNPTYCIEAASKCPTKKDEIKGLFDAGEGGSWNVMVHGGATEVVLVCKKGYRVEKYGMIRTVCTAGHWAGDVSRCVPDVDHCDAGNPKALDTEVVNGNWKCTKYSPTGGVVEFYRKRRDSDDDEGSDRGYGHSHGHHHHDHYGHGHDHYGHGHDHYGHGHDHYGHGHDHYGHGHTHHGHGHGHGHYGDGHHHNVVKDEHYEVWECELICKDGYQTVLVKHLIYNCICNFNVLKGKNLLKSIL